MADNIKIQLSDLYDPITDDDIRKSKKWTLLREDNATYLSGLIESILKDTIQSLTLIAYKYNCKPEEWQFAQNKDLREEVANIMNDAEDEIMDLVEEYSLNETKDKKRRSTLLPWLLALKSKGTKDLQSTLHARLRQFLFDTEAQIAAMKLAGYAQSKASNRAVSTMHSVYTSPEMQAAFKKQSAAMYIQSKGVHYGNVGLSSSGAVNVENFGEQTATIAWMKSQLLQFQEDGAAGYYQLRGSTYPCSLCDDEVGLHIGDIINDPYPHHHCVCYRVPVFEKQTEKETQKEETLKEQRKRIKEEAASLQQEVFANKDVEWEASISGAGIKEWINQPHKLYREKNEALLNIKELFKDADYVGHIPDSKNRDYVEQSHIFKTKIGGEDSWIIVHETIWNTYFIHSIADNNPIK